MELPISDEVIDLPTSLLHAWADALLGEAIDNHDLNPALPCGVAGGSLEGGLSDAWMLVNVALHDAARSRVTAA